MLCRSHTRHRQHHGQDRKRRQTPSARGARTTRAPQCCVRCFWSRRSTSAMRISSSRSPGPWPTFRATVGSDLDDPFCKDLVAELSLKSDDFRRLWADHDVLSAAGVRPVSAPGGWLDAPELSDLRRRRHRPTGPVRDDRSSRQPRRASARPNRRPGAVPPRRLTATAQRAAPDSSPPLPRERCERRSTARREDHGAAPRFAARTASCEMGRPARSVERPRCWCQAHCESGGHERETRHGRSARPCSAYAVLKHPALISGRSFSPRVVIVLTSALCRRAGHCCILGSCVGSAYMGGQP